MKPRKISFYRTKTVVQCDDGGSETMPFVSNDGFALHHRQGQAGSNAARSEFNGTVGQLRDPAMPDLTGGRRR
jgi:hypothetical protein